MKRVKTIGLIVLVLALSIAWFVGGCTGGGVFDSSPTPTATATGPVAAPTITFTPGMTLSQLVTGQNSVFNLALWGDSSYADYFKALVVNSVQYYIGEHIYWLESISQGTVKFMEYDRRPNGTSTSSVLVSGKPNPYAILLRRLQTDVNNPSNCEDRMFVSTSVDPNSTIMAYTKTGTSVDQGVQMTVGQTGTIWYMAFDNKSPLNPNPNIYYSLDVESGNSSIRRVNAPAANIPSNVNPDILDSSLNHSHHVYVFRQEIPLNSGVNPNANANTFVFATENVTNGRVLMYNVSTWDGTAVQTPVVIATGQQRPSKMTFIPDIEQYSVPDPSGSGGTINVYGTTRNPSGFLYWTNFHPTSGEIMRARLVYNATSRNMEVDATTGIQVVANSLASPYDIIGPNDYRYTYVTGNSQGGTTNITGVAPALTYGAYKFQYNSWAELNAQSNNMFGLLYVSSNLSQPNNGNWYEVDTTQYVNGQPMNPNSAGVSSYLSNAAQFPLNGQMEIFVLVDPTTPGVGQQIFKKDLFFTSFDFESVGNADSVIYLQQNSFTAVP